MHRPWRATVGSALFARARRWFVVLVATLAAMLALTGCSQSHARVTADAPRQEAELKLPPPPDHFLNYDGGWFQLYYPPAERERVQPLINDADATRHDLRTRLGQNVLDTVRVYVARTPGEMSGYAPEGAPFPEYAVGVAYPSIGLVLLTLRPVHPNDRLELGETFAHELAHVALHDAVQGKHVPRWFDEGFAVYASGESSFNRLQTLWTSTLANTLVPLSSLDRGFSGEETQAAIAYAESADVLRYLLRQQDRHRFAAMIDKIRAGRSFDVAMEAAYATDTASLEYEWREDVAKRYSFWPVLLSGTVVWVGIMGLFVLGWRRKRTRSRATLARWAKEEAREDQLARELTTAPPQRVHIVLAPSSPRSSSPQLRPSIPDADIPKVEHDGRWHTLH